MNPKSIETLDSAIGAAATVYGLETSDEEREADYRVSVGGDVMFTDRVRFHGAEVEVGKGETVSFAAEAGAEMVVVDRAYIDKSGSREAVADITQAAHPDK